MTRTGFATLAVCLLSTLPLAAQETPAPPADTAAAKAPRAPDAPRRRKDFIPVRVTITIARLDNEKKLLNLPFTLLVNACDNCAGGKSSLRMGIETPVRVGGGSDKDGKGLTSYQYKNVGTNIDVRAEGLDDGRFNLDIKVEQSSLGASPDKQTPVAADLPLFRTFNTQFFALLRDGQTTTNVVATDSLNGESVRIEVALNVVR